MLEYIQLGDKVELLTELDKDGNQEHYYSSVQEVVDGELVISAPITKGKIEPLEILRTYGMCVYTKKGLYRCEVELVSREKRDKLFLLTIRLQSDLVKYQRRQYYRMDCILEFSFKGIDTDEWYKAVILDISGGGIRFYTRKKLKEGDGIFNHILLNVSEKEHDLFLGGKVVDVEKHERDREVQYEVRESFDSIDEGDRETIIKYIFDEERRRRRNRVK